MKIEIIGVCPVQSREPCYLVELWVRDLSGELPLGDFTQEYADKPQDSWQVPYDERVINESGTMQVGNRFPRSIQGEGSDLRIAFFFHYLDFSKPLLSPVGPLQLPAWRPPPSRLDFFKYEPPG